MGSDQDYQRVAVAPFGLLKQAASLMGDQYWMFLAITFVGMIIASLLPMGILYGPMACGIYLCYLIRMQGKRPDFETLFKGFDVFVESLVATLVIIIVTMIVIVPMVILIVAASLAGAIAADNGGAPPWILLLMLLAIPFSMIVSLVLSALFIFVYPLIVDKDMKAVPALKTSCRAAWANLGGIVWAMIVWGVIAGLSVLACGIGPIFFTPLMFGAIAILYRQIFPVSTAQTEGFQTSPDVNYPAAK